MPAAIAMVMTGAVGRFAPLAWDAALLPAGFSISGSVVSTGGPALNRTARVTPTRDAGKWYKEIEVVALGTNLRLGLCQPGHSVNAQLANSAPLSVGYELAAKTLWPGGTAYGPGGFTAAARTVICVAADLGTGKVWIGTPGLWFGSGNPVTGANPTWTLTTGVSWALAMSGNNTAKVMLVQQPACDPPTGFAAWNGDALSVPGLYVSTVPFTTNAGDTPAHTHFAGRLKVDAFPEIARGINVRIWGGPRRENTIGAVDLVATDGRLDDLLPAQVRDRKLEFYQGETEAPFSTWTKIAEAVADRVDCPDERTCRITVRDQGAIYEVQVQQLLYGEEVSNTALRGAPRPIAIGAPLSCEVPLEQPAELIFGAHEVPPKAIVTVRDQGAVVTPGSGWVAAQNGFDKLSAVFGKVVADVQGAQDTFGALIDRLPAIIKYLLGRRGIDPSKIETTSVNALDAACPYALARWIDKSMLLSDLLTELLDSFCGAWWINRNGLLQVGRLFNPNDKAVPDLVLTEADIALHELRVEMDRAPYLSTVWLGARNWYVHRDAEVASAVLVTQAGQDLLRDHRVRVHASGVQLDPAYQHAVGAAGDRSGGTGMATLLGQSAHVQAVANAVCGLYTQPRFFVGVPTFRIAARLLEPLQVVQLFAPRYGFDGGKKCLVRRVGFRAPSTRTELRLWA